uniref:TIGR03960 family B12-binding radical SAM protein n=1 Tax=Desulfatirhabdium butyrativorans TaxID=340467 RepID=A0A7C4MMX9_9BACT
MTRSSSRAPSDAHFWEALGGIEQPSRYIGFEPNHIRKRPEEIKLFFALAFPEMYEIGMSHFGIQILYHILNREPDIAAERVFAPGPDLYERMVRENQPLVSLESKRPLRDFDIIGFSLLYELTYTNVLYMLESAGIPFDARNRDGKVPFVVAGGPCTVNPEPMARFFDAMVVGDGERVVLAMTNAWMNWKNEGAASREDLLERWAVIEGVYIPRFYHVQTDGLGFRLRIPEANVPARIRRAVVADLDRAAFPESPLVPFGKPVHDRLRLEISRGCSRGCRFCQAGMIYRPVRERSISTIMKQARAAVDATGYEDLSLLSLSTGDYTELERLMDALMGHCEPLHVAVSLPSIRADRLSKPLMEAIKRVRKTGFTIAPEAGSQRLRNVINKNLVEEDIRKAVEDAFSLGWQVVKLYFMIGLPTEEDADLDALVDLVKGLRGLLRSFGKHRRGEIHTSLATFIPKPHTPFQWEPQISIDEAYRRLSSIRHRLQMPGISVKWQQPEVSFLEGVLARGDDRCSAVIETAYRMGCRFDGWSDHFRFDRWMAAFDAEGVDPTAFVHRKRELDEPLPWDHIDIRVTKDFLQAEHRLAMEGRPTPDCRQAECSGCGACDFDILQPVLCRDMPEADRSDGLPSGVVERPYAPRWKSVVLRYTKTGSARFLGHLEVYNLFCRAFRRSGVSVEFSEGFHPKPKLSFDEALPIGLASMCETFRASVDADTDCNTLVERLNHALIEGIRIIGCEPAIPASKGQKTQSNGATYRVTLFRNGFHREALVRFEQADTFEITRTNRKGITRRIDLKQIVPEIRLLSDTSCEMRLLHAQDAVLRPADVLRAVWQFPEEVIQEAEVTKVA